MNLMWTIEKVFNISIVSSSESNKQSQKALESLIENIYSPGIVSIDIADLIQQTENAKDVQVLLKAYCFVSNLEKIPFYFLSEVPCTAKTIWVNIWFGEKCKNNQFEIFEKVYALIEPYIVNSIEPIFTDAYRKNSSENTIEIVAFS